MDEVEARLAEAIIELVSEAAYRPLTEEELAEAVEMTPAEADAFAAALAELIALGKVVRTRAGRYAHPRRMNLTVGRLQGHPRGFSFAIPDERDMPDLYISAENRAGAWHGDRIIARLLPGGSRGGRTEGEVIRVLTRANDRIVGTYHTSALTGYVTPDEQRLSEDVFIPDAHRSDAQDGETVVIEVERWPDGRRPAEGRIIERLGFKSEPGVDVLAIVRQYRLPETFDEQVMAEAAAVPEAPTEEDMAGREDLRQLTTVTIDGEDARDLDDAISLERLADNGFRLGVHIADVSHYVPEGSALDKEARKRATSVYLVDRVIPMLPPALSNGICSLNPGVDRLTLSIFLEFDSDGRLRSHRIAEGVIRTAARLTYTGVHRMLLGIDDELLERYEQLVPMLHDMNELRALLRERREARGSLDFDLAEEVVVLDRDGHPIEVRPAVRTVADQIIEEFMLAANEAVAEEYVHREVPFVYRIHEEPDEEKLANLAEFLSNFGLRLPVMRWPQPRALQDVLARAAERPEERLINSVVLRSLKQARYAPENVGHFGLASRYYTHYTAPIRRYPDLLIHRVIKECLRHGRPRPRQEARWTKSFPDLTVHCSEQERHAEEASRESVQLKKVQYMAGKIGEEYVGIISGVTNFGLFVELENTCEGLIHVSNMTDDFYTYIEKQYALIGERTRQMFRLGDKLRIRVIDANVESQQISFELLESLQRPPARGRKTGGAPGRLKPPPGKAAKHARVREGSRDGDDRRGGRGKKGKTKFRTRQNRPR